MQAIEIHSFLPPSVPYSSLKVSRVVLPKPQQDQLLIRITHVSLNQVDLLFARGKHQNNNAKHGHVLPPFILGMDFAGTVEGAPSVATSSAIHVGDKVMGCCYGAFAEFICVRPDQVVKMPLTLDPCAAASLVMGIVSYDVVTVTANVQPGQSVLVSGANGGLGVVACQVAKACGAKVIALVSSSDKAQFLRSRLELDHVVATEDSDWVEQVKRRAPDGIDAVIDNVGLVTDGLRCLKVGGCIVIVGFAGRGGVMEQVATNRVLLKAATVVGYRMGKQSRQHLDQAWRGYNELLSSGMVKAVIDPGHYQGLEDIPRALEDLSKRKMRGRVVVAIRKENAVKL